MHEIKELVRLEINNSFGMTLFLPLSWYMLLLPDNH